MTTHTLNQLVPSQFAAHALHRGSRAWPESNCYVDLWIELLHALGHEPTACLAFTFATDFEGDQFTFFKPPLADLERLYGIDVRELELWRPLVDHITEQLRLGRIVLVEVDAYYLPDAVGTDYRAQHTKTTIGITGIDPERKRLRYLHNAGCFELSDDDFDGALRRCPLPASALPPYTEIVKMGHATPRPDEALVDLARTLLKEHLARAPSYNPCLAYAERVAQDISWLASQDLATYHRYAFANLRQCGSCFDLSAMFLRWLARHGDASLLAPADDFDGVAHGAKALMLKLARMVHGGRPFDPQPVLAEMAERWQSGMHRLGDWHAG